MTLAFKNLALRALVAVFVCTLLTVAGCEQSYKPAAYKAAPRVDSTSPESSTNESSKKGRLPNITDWTSPEALRGVTGGSAPNRGYRGISGYRGIGGYRGIAPRGYAGIRGYRGYGQSKAYRGYGQQRAYRGN